MSLLQTISRFRQAYTLRGDTLRRIAAREMGDASQWYQLIYVNKLIFPFITDDPHVAGDGIILTGNPILIPSVTSSQAMTDPNIVYGQDVALTKGFLSVTGQGDLAIVSGKNNLEQALANRVQTGLGELDFHLDYGCSARAIVGNGGRGSVNSLVVSFVKRSLLQDPRVKDVQSATVALAGDVLSVNAVVEAINGVTEGVSI